MATQDNNQPPEYTDVQKELIEVADYLTDAGLKEKEAVVGRSRVYYFRTDDFALTVLAHKERVLELLATHTKFETLESEKDVIELGNLFVKNGLLRAYDRIKDDLKKFKYPKKLQPARPAMHGKLWLRKLLEKICTYRERILLIQHLQISNHFTLHLIHLRWNRVSTSALPSLAI